LAGGAALTQPAVQSFAQGALQSFRVQRTQPVVVDLAALRGLPGPHFDTLMGVGTYTGTKDPKVRSASVAEAARATGLALRAPARLPAGLSGPPAVWVSDAVTFTFTYDGEKLAQAAHSLGVTDASLLAQLRAADGLTAKGSVPAAAALVYGDPFPAEAAYPAGAPVPTREAARRGAQAGQGTPAQPYAGTPAGTGAPPGARATGGRPGGAAEARPFLGLIQLRIPTMTLEAPKDKDVNVDRLREQLLRSEAVPPQLSNQLLGIADWKTTLPIPVTRGTAREVPVDGTTGTLVIGEVPGPALVWQKDGVLYVIGGQVPEAVLLDAARSLAPAKA
jgi:hypothetical protein